MPLKIVALARAGSAVSTLAQRSRAFMPSARRAATAGRRARHGEASSRSSPAARL